MARPSTVATASGVRTPARIYLDDSFGTLSTTSRVGNRPIKSFDLTIAAGIDGSTFTVDLPVPMADIAAVVMAPGAMRATRRAKGRYFIVSLHPTHPRYRQACALMKRPAMALPADLFAAFAQPLADAYHGRLEAPQAADLGARLLDTVLRDAPAVAPLHPRVQAAMEGLEADIHLPLELLARELGLSASRLSHQFSEELGISFQSFQTWKRVLRAWELVALRPELSLTEIAHRMRYSDSSHLSRAFRSAFGLTPTQMRNGGLVEVHGAPRLRVASFGTEP